MKNSYGCTEARKNGIEKEDLAIEALKKIAEQYKLEVYHNSKIDIYGVDFYIKYKGIIVFKGDIKTPSNKNRNKNLSVSYSQKNTNFFIDGNELIANSNKKSVALCSDVVGEYENYFLVEKTKTIHELFQLCVEILKKMGKYEKI